MKDEVSQQITTSMYAKGGTGVALGGGTVLTPDMLFQIIGLIFTAFFFILAVMDYRKKRRHEIEMRNIAREKRIKELKAEGVI